MIVLSNLLTIDTVFTVFIVGYRKRCKVLALQDTPTFLIQFSCQLIFSLRMVLHNSITPQSSNAIQQIQSTNIENCHSAQSLVKKVLEESFLKLKDEATRHRKFIRWELGACWVQHLQNQEPKKAEEDKLEPYVKGLGKHGGLLKKKKIDIVSLKVEQEKDNDLNKHDATQQELDRQCEEMETIWRKLLPDAAYSRLKESKTDFHLKVDTCCHGFKL